MSMNETEKTGFEEAMKRGKRYEARVQQEIAKCSSGSTYPNVRVGCICEFDVVVADYPVLSFVEVKFYRANLEPNRVRTAIRLFRNHCKRVTEEKADWKKKWIPYLPQVDPSVSTNTHKDTLFKKLSLFIPEGWRYRMILVVPNKSIDAVLGSLNENKMPSSKKHAQNLRLVDGIPLIAISEKRINEVFG
jgi:hypothetical protein